MTMCVQYMEPRFGAIEDGEVRLSLAGEMVARVWQKNIERYPGAALYGIRVDSWGEDGRNRERRFPP